MTPPGTGPVRGTSRGTRVVALLGAVLALGLLAASLSRFAASEFRSPSGWLLYVLAVAAAGGASLPFRGRPADPAERVVAWELVALGLLLVVAAAFRLRALADYPFGIWFDEAENTLVVERILAERGYAPVFVAGASKMPALAFYVFAPFVKVFTGPVLGVRAAAAAAGLLAVVAVWLVGRELGGPRVALLAAGFLAVSRWHVTFSRFGMAMIFTTLVPPLVFFLAERSQRRGSPRDAVWAGLVLGLGIQLYYSLIALPLIVALLGLRRMVRRGARTWAPAGLALLTLASAAFAYAPLGLFARHDPEHFAERFRATAVLNVSSYAELARLLVTPSPARAHAAGVLAENLRRHALMFHVAGDPNGRHNLPGAPMLDPVTGVLFGAGLLLCLATLATERSLLLVLWFAAFMAAGVLSLEDEAPQAARTLGALPAVVLMAALPLEWLWRRARGAGSSPVRSALATLVPVACLGAAAGHSAYTFFRVQRYDFGAWASWSTPETKVARVVEAEGAGAAVFVPPPFVTSPTIRFVLGRPFEGRAFVSGRDLPLETGGRRALVFLTPNADPEGRTLLARLYPHTAFEEFVLRSPSGEASPSILTIARVPLSDLEALHAWRTSLVARNAEVDDRAARETVWDWSNRAAAPPFEARVRGRLSVVEDGLYRLVLVTTEPARLSLDGGAIAAGAGRREARVLLARGMHDVALDVSVAHAAGRTTLTWVRPGSAREEPIPSASIISPLQAFGGLLGSYYHGTGFDGSPVFRRIDPGVAFYFHDIPVARPFAIRWTGTLEAPAAGPYRFSTRSIDESTVRVDGREVVRNPGSLQDVEGAVDLARGPHAFDVTLRNSSDYAQIFLSWTPPGGTREIIPTEVLRPPRPVPEGPAFP